MQQIIELAEIGPKTCQTVSISAPNIPAAGLLRDSLRGYRLYAGVGSGQPINRTCEVSQESPGTVLGARGRSGTTLGIREGLGNRR
jgi:hypothetical protein